MNGKMLLQNSQVLRAGLLPRVQNKPALGDRQIARAEEKKGGAVAKKDEDKKPAKAEKKSDGYNRNKSKLFVPSEQSLSYLDGSRAADYGFDPLGLMDPEGAMDSAKGEGFINPSWLTYAEVYHSRWAMLGAAGCIIPEILASGGLIPQTPAEVTWFRAGVFPPAGSYTYWTDAYSLFFLELVLFNFVELRRNQDFRSPGSMGKQYLLGLEKGLGGSGDPAYPGGLFNPLGFGRSGGSLQDLKTKELKNGRLAMVAMLGYSGQAVMTGEGPFKNLIDHLSSPFGSNILTNFEQFGARHL